VLPPTPLGNKRGRKLGTPNKHTRLFKDACLLAAMHDQPAVRAERSRIGGERSAAAVSGYSAPKVIPMRKALGRKARERGNDFNSASCGRYR
jgi:hypothetical protein